MVCQQSVCLRRLALGQRREIVAFNRFLANPRVTAEALIEGWSEATSAACADMHILALQDTSEFTFRTTEEDRRGLGKIGKGSGHGLLLHPMLGVDADTGALVGLVTGSIWTRSGAVERPHSQRPLSEKEAKRWLDTADAAKPVLAKARMVTDVSDRESDIYARWARVPHENFHILTRAMHDRLIEEGGGKLSSAPLTTAGMADIALRARPGRPARTAHLKAAYGRVTLKRPINTLEDNLPETVSVSLVEVTEVDTPAGSEPILWRLLTTHPVDDPAKAWRIVEWYRMRWIIEQFFRTLKLQGLQLEDSQVETAERLIKLTAVAAHAAALIMQLVQAREGQSDQKAEIAFTPNEIDTLEALLPKLEGKTELQKNPHPPRSMAWAAWIIAKLGGWDGYPRSKPPGPVTFKHGLDTFKSIAIGWALRDV